MSTLDVLEARLQTLLEVQLLKSMPGYKAEDKVHQELAAAMHNSLKEQDGITYAPNEYVIIVHPSTLERWRSEPRMEKELGDALQIAGEEARYTFLSAPTVSTAADTDMAANETRIIASYNSEGVAKTQGMPSGSHSKAQADPIPTNAFLILDGTKIIPLNRPVINIGRRLDNQVVIDDQRVSRNHAQLRVSKGCFSLFDLNSTGGTFINGQQVNKSTLHPGDVISLAGVTLIFSQDLPSGSDQEKGMTQPRSAISADRQTAVILETGNNNKKKVKKK